MGNLVQSSTPLELQKRYKVIKEGHHELTLLQQLETGNEYCLKCFMFNSNQGLEACVEKLNGKKRINHQHLLAIKQIYSRSENTFCSNVHKVYAIIEYPFRTLSEQIIERKRNWDYFSETQLWSIVYSCSMALNYLYSTNLTHGCLTSSRIYIQNEGLIKISDPGLFNENSNLTSYMTNSNCQYAYVSPEQLQKINSRDERKDSGTEISDVFVLGMIILEAVHLQSMEEVYDNGINYKILGAKINSIEPRYSKQLRTIVERMLTGKPDERITFEEIETIIQNNNFEDQSAQSDDSSRRNSFSSRRPLDSIPSYNNLQTERKDQIKPSKVSAVKQSFNSQGNKNKFQQIPLVNYKSAQENISVSHPYNYNYVVQQVQVNQPIQTNNLSQPPQIKRIEPLTIYSPVYSTTPANTVPITANYNVPSYVSNYYPTSTYSPTSQYSNYWTQGAPSNNFTNIPNSQNVFPKLQNVTRALQFPTYQNQPSPKLSSNSNFNMPIISNTNSTFKISLAPSVSLPTSHSVQPTKPTESGKDEYNTTLMITPPLVKLPTSNIPLNDYKYQPLSFQKLSINNEQASPVERLKTIEQIQQIQRQQPQRKAILQHPNSVIAEVTETEISGLESPTKQEQIDPNSQPQYVNEDSESGSHYQGYKLNGKKHGFGRLYYQDGGYYEGEWKFNKMNGFAKLYYQSGDIAYEGYWVNDKLHGKGKVFNDNPVDLDSSFDYRDFTGLDDYWQFYDGEFAMDAKQGFGTIKLTNGEIFEGEFDKDVIEGRGKFYSLSGKIINGLWKENKLFETS